MNLPEGGRGKTAARTPPGPSLWVAWVWTTGESSEDEPRRSKCLTRLSPVGSAKRGLLLQKQCRMNPWVYAGSRPARMSLMLLSSATAIITISSFSWVTEGSVSAKFTRCRENTTRSKREDMCC
jgi:hypothetical protein